MGPAVKPSPAQPYGLGPLSRIAGEGAERSEAGEGVSVPSFLLPETAAIQFPPILNPRIGDALPLDVHDGIGSATLGIPA